MAAPPSTGVPALGATPDRPRYDPVVDVEFPRNTIAADPIARTNSNRCRDRGNVFTDVLRRAPAGKINPNRTQVDDPKEMSAHIKNVGHYFGADIVGIGRAHPALLYAGGTLRDTGFIVDAEDGPTEGPAELCRKYPYVIVTPVAWDYDLAQAHRHHIGDAAYDTTLMQTVLVLSALESYIRELGYTALRGKVNPQAAGHQPLADLPDVHDGVSVYQTEHVVADARAPDAAEHPQAFAAGCGALVEVDRRPGVGQSAQQARALARV